MCRYPMAMNAMTRNILKLVSLSALFLALAVDRVAHGSHQPNPPLGKARVSFAKDLA